VGGLGLIAGFVALGDPIDGRLPFDSPVLAGVALIVLVAVPLTALAWSAFSAGPRTDELALVSGVLLIGWIVGQVVVIRTFSWFQPLYLVIGVGFVVVSNRVTVTPRRRGVLFAAVGAIVVSVGIGLVPHLVKTGLTITSLVSLVLMASGVALVGVGAVSALRGGRRLAAAAGGVVVLVAVVAAVSTIAPAVAATNVPDTEITSTPGDLGLTYESVTVTTTDGVELAAWYLPGGNGAGLVVLHGAGSTRSDVLDQTEVLARGGYAVLMVDARGHGDSRGTAMDFGWYGDPDVVAGIGFLASRPDVEPGRIGVVGFSMGGEEAIGAAAADARIRAVVAEGATARRAADKAWLSDVYGWRGWLQEQLEQVQDGITTYLTEASRPTTLRAAVTEATGTRFLLITAGEAADEGHAATYITAAASDRVDVWNVEGADHTGGYETVPDDWAERVLGFLDESLG
jgi:fermentation-respiration switch protein FrsA (DUF1100 family)